MEFEVDEKFSGQQKRGISDAWVEPIAAFSTQESRGLDANGEPTGLMHAFSPKIDAKSLSRKPDAAQTLELVKKLFAKDRQPPQCQTGSADEERP